jgi:malate dehydrogenase (oxaloacetate-decarboxylating)(NADP+)
MEGKGLLFKIFADIDVFDLEINELNPKRFIEIVKSLEPTFGGINLEDIKSPECFEIEETLKREMNIPVFHDDQHGTAIIAGAALINALFLVKKNIKKVSIIINGAGAAGLSIAKHLLLLGASKENIILCDINGVISKKSNCNERQRYFATEKNVSTLSDAVKGADVLIGVSVADIFTKNMLISMSSNPIVFAMANPKPEINYEDALSAREDIIFATGRSDYPNQVNNVLGFPFIFRAALDVNATDINDAMKLAASIALAKLARQKVPKYVCDAYNVDSLKFGKNYIIPKPLDLRVIEYVAVAVAKEAIASGVAKLIIEDWNDYKLQLRQRVRNVHKRYSKTVL